MVRRDEPVQAAGKDGSRRQRISSHDLLPRLPHLRQAGQRCILHFHALGRANVSDAVVNDVSLHTWPGSAAV